jgi:hypothetical protein
VNAVTSAIDTLKPLDKVFAPDPRYAADGRPLGPWHAELAEIDLHDGVPIDVRQQFETAKNLSLYAWFVFRFHPIAGLVARAALEMALRARWVAEYGSQPSHPERGLSKLLKHAVETKWLRPEAFRSMASAALSRASERKLLDILTRDEPGEAFSVLPPTPAEIQKEFELMDMPGRLARSTPRVRNEIAHGSRAIGGGSVGTLRRMADAIDCLFVEPSGGTRRPGYWR